jgi:hypothetical protein
MGEKPDYYTACVIIGARFLWSGSFLQSVPLALLARVRCYVFMITLDLTVQTVALSGIGLADMYPSAFRILHIYNNRY